MRRLKDIAGKRVALRPPSAGVRAHFDRALATEGGSLAALRCRVALFDSHGDAVFAVLRGERDVALTTSAWAERAGLAFLSVASEPYDLLVHADNLGSPVAIAVCEVAQSPAFRKSLASIAGYDPRRAGEDPLRALTDGDDLTSADSMLRRVDSARTARGPMRAACAFSGGRETPPVTSASFERKLRAVPGEPMPFRPRVRPIVLGLAALGVASSLQGAPLSAAEPAARRRAA